jgi:hypothetical protein
MISSGRAALLLLLASLTATAVGCAEPEGEPIASADADMIGRVKGSTLGSAYAKPSSTYLTVRTVSLLEQVNALSEDVMKLADRVDGIIANQPPDGRVSVQELVKIEQPGFIETLFPAEKAALPKLWALMETSNAAPKNPSAVAALPTIQVQDTSKAAGTLSAPTFLAINELPSELQQAANRVQLTKDSDNDDATITVADLNAVIATPGPYTPAEVKQFEEILAIFTARAKSSIASTATIQAPFAKSSTLSALGTAKLRVEDSFVLRESRRLSMSGSSGSTQVTLEGFLKRNLLVETAPGEQVIAIAETSESERLIAGTLDGLETGVTTFEVWANGQRKSIHRVKFASAFEGKDERIDLSKWADHTFSAGNTTLFRNVVTATSTYNSYYNRHYGNQSTQSYSATFEYGTTAVAPTGEVDNGALSRVATPSGIVPGRYEVSAGSAGKVRIDVSPTGVVNVTRLTTGASVRSHLYTWHDGTKFDTNFPDRFRVLIHGSTGEISIFFDGQGQLFQGYLKAANRVG